MPPRKKSRSPETSKAGNETEPPQMTRQADEVEMCSKCLHCGPHWVFPWIPLHCTGHTQMVVPTFPALQTFNPIVPHPVNSDTNYRLWSLVSKQGDGLLQRDSNNVTADGSFSASGSSNTVITTSAISYDYVSLLFKDGGENYVITADGGIIKAVAEAGGYPYPDDATFTFAYYFSYTVFKNKKFNTKYLGCNSAGNVTLVDMESLQYPNPQALFILNKVEMAQC